MKLGIGIGMAAAAVALVIPLSANAAGAATTDYNPACDMAYQAGKPVFDPMIAAGPGFTSAVELAACGENKYGGGAPPALPAP